jgi:integrase
MRQMGHTTIKMLEQHYGRWMSEEMPDMADKVSALMGFDNSVQPMALQNQR